MTYKKQFSASLLIFPDFYKNEYFDYIKEKINNWIFECFNTYTDYFTINLVQPSGIAKFYDYDKRTDGSNINFEKIWKNPYGSYYIFLEGFGEVLLGTSEKNLLPPRELTELTLNNINVKYKEYTSINGLKMISFGKENGLPCEFNCNCYDVENWRNFISEEIDCICHDFKISMHISKDIFDQIFNIVNNIIDLDPNNSKYLFLDIDEEEGYIELSGKYLLKQNIKEDFYNLCQLMAEILIQDDLFVIDELNMDFIAVDKKIFYFEKYIFNDLIGKFNRKSILL